MLQHDGKEGGLSCFICNSLSESTHCGSSWQLDPAQRNQHAHCMLLPHVALVRPDVQSARPAVDVCRSVHRGSYFTEMRTTTVRKLLPESWGFLCPVHTPDGSPCGLLNHFTAACSIITEGPSEPQARELGLVEVRQDWGWG